MGIIVGLAAGLLGVGGGFLMVPLQYFALQTIGIPSDLAFRIALGTSLTCIIPTSLSGAYTHIKESKIDILKPGIMFGVFGIIGGFIGGNISTIIPTRALEILFGLLLIGIAINMFLKKDDTENEPKLKLNYLTAGIIGIVVGFFAGLLGIGGGVFIIPILTMLFGFTMVEAIGTSTIFIPFSSIGGSISYMLSGWGANILPYSIGYVNLVNFILIIIFSIPMAHYGAKIAYKINEKHLRILFAIVLVIISLKMLKILPF
ncbi:sulfite exporter TauE/SafE family protein [Methanobrevibacter boviskoreani]|uniref:sulfite exporter TauE/SafE family protein n=1 Tax=Methanobrevibacter boviskoreani TaxID=1348249 RepID=UPI002A908633|nr:sulfite exporter TauE/SafE family protein [Methanobrevibacter boviskoreani]MDY5614453.1 sulfite exporter TauE/SafE family protein [Methanobrevibacter boviskoreani]